MPSHTLHGKRHRLEMYMEPLDVTRSSRPDEHWRFVDSSGHVHQWEWPDGVRHYRPDQPATIPTTKEVITASWIDEDGDECEEAHLECVQCGAVVKPGYTADTHRQYIAGPTTYLVDGVSVSPEEYARIWAEESSTTP